MTEITKVFCYTVFNVMRLACILTCECLQLPRSTSMIKRLTRMHHICEIQIPGGPI